MTRGRLPPGACAHGSRLKKGVWHAFCVWPPATGRRCLPCVASLPALTLPPPPADWGQGCFQGFYFGLGYGLGALAGGLVARRYGLQALFACSSVAMLSFLLTCLAAKRAIAAVEGRSSNFRGGGGGGSGGAYVQLATSANEDERLETA